MNAAANSPLGSPSTVYPKKYSKEILFPISRLHGRQNILDGNELPFYGYDEWNAWELSWLNKSGLPQLGIARILVPCESPALIESKSLKLYLNSLNNEKFLDRIEVQNLLASDLSEKIGAKVEVQVYWLEEYPHRISRPTGICLERQAGSFQQEKYSVELLKKESDELVYEQLYSHLLKSNCPVTKQPDWATLTINYKGPKICHDSLLRYILSFRDHDEFHEQCVERIFLAISQLTNPIELTINARYTRRGGIDINPLRSTSQTSFLPQRFVRQ